ncbi:MAG: flippase-like domain-containing protein [Bacteroidota bacterium]|nr:flippase-like domain-containing protein [Bacteroidota bacterium]
MRIFKLLLFFLTFICIGYFVYEYEEKLSLLKEISISNLLVLLVIGFLIQALQSFPFYLVTRILHKNFSFLNAFYITTISSMYNQILPLNSGGIAVRAALINRKYKLSWDKITAILSVFYFTGYYAISVLLIVLSALFTFFYSQEIKFFNTLLAFFILLNAFLLLFIKYKQLLNFKWKVVVFLSKIIETSKLFLKEKDKVIYNMLSQIVIVFVMAVKLYCSFLFLGLEVDFWKIFFIQTLLALSLVFSITPGDLGVKEGIVILFTGLIGLSPENILFATLLDRITSVIVVFLLGLLSKYLYLRGFKSPIEDPQLAN